MCGGSSRGSSAGCCPGSGLYGPRGGWTVSWQGRRAKTMTRRQTQTLSVRSAKASTPQSAKLPGWRATASGLLGSGPSCTRSTRSTPSSPTWAHGAKTALVNVPLSRPRLRGEGRESQPSARVRCAATGALRSHAVPSSVSSWRPWSSSRAIWFCGIARTRLALTGQTWWLTLNWESTRWPCSCA